ncbi:MAG: hypothetical protein V2A71_00695 [Candidatus Eisenbacteria bacterium]
MRLKYSHALPCLATVCVAAGLAVFSLPILERAAHAFGSATGGRHSPELVWSREESVNEGLTAAFVTPNNARSIAAEANGTVHIVFCGNFELYYDIYYRQRTSEGWGKQEQMTFTASTCTTPALALDRKGNVHAVWSDNPDRNYDLYFSSRANGKWTIPERLTEGIGTSFFPSLSYSADGTLHLVWEEGDGRTSRVFYMRRSALKWSKPLCLNKPEEGSAREPSVDAGPGGSVHVVWTQEKDGKGTIVYRECSHGTWKKVVRLVKGPFALGRALGIKRGLDAGRTSDARRGSIEADGAGNLHVVWEDHRFDKPAVCYRERRAGKWRDEILLTDSSYAAFRPAVEAGRDDEVCVVWYDDRHGQTDAFFCQRRGAKWGPHVRLTDSPEATYFVSLACREDGSAHVIFQDRRRGTYDIYYRKGTRR